MQTPKISTSAEWKLDARVGSPEPATERWAHPHPGAASSAVRSSRRSKEVSTSGRPGLRRDRGT